MSYAANYKAAYLLSVNIDYFSMNEDLDFTTDKCDWTEKDAEHVAEYDVLLTLGMKNVKTLNTQEQS